MGQYAIVGFGCAGYHAAKAIRACGDTSPIHAYEATDAPPANPMLTTYYVSGKIPGENAYPFGSLEQIRRELSITVKSRCRVRRVEAGSRCILGEDGSRIAYDRILISTGARALTPPIGGLPDPRVFPMRTMDHAQGLLRYLEGNPVGDAVVAGASMTGIKLAELLLNRGIKVAMVDMGPHIFPATAFPEIAREVERRLVLQGLVFRWNAALEAVTPRGVVLSGGEELEAGVVCLGIGTRPNVELVGRTGVVAGQPVAVDRGILTDRRMQTTAPGIYAAGDCCQGFDLQSGGTRMIGLWANAVRQGETAGRNIAGRQALYPGSLPHNVSRFLGVVFTGIGDCTLPGEAVQWGSQAGPLYIRATKAAGRLLCINVLGGERIGGILKSLFVQRLADPAATLSPEQRAALLRDGVPGNFIQELEERP